MEKILIIDNILLTSVNQKYINKKYVLSSKYRAFKQEVSWKIANHSIKPPYFMWILMETGLDIDNALKPILDGIEHTLSNDKDIHRLFLDKIAFKRGKPGRLSIWCETLKDRFKPIIPPFSALDYSCPELPY